MLIISHRGKHDGAIFPENSFSCSQKTVDMGFKTIEIDIHFYKPFKSLFVTHDKHFLSEFGTKKISINKIDYDRLRLEIDELDEFSPLFKRDDITLILDLKGSYSHDYKIALLTFLDSIPINCNVVFSSYNWKLIKKLKKNIINKNRSILYNPNKIKFGIIKDNLDWSVNWFIKRNKIDIISFNTYNLKILRKIRNNTCIKLYKFTIGSSKELSLINDLKENYVHGIYTDIPLICSTFIRNVNN